MKSRELVAVDWRGLKSNTTVGRNKGALGDITPTTCGTYFSLVIIAAGN
jgi:hypothetical protein